LLRNRSRLQLFRLNSGRAIAAFSNAFFDGSLGLFLIVEAYLEFVYGWFKGVETLPKHGDLQKRLKEILGNAWFRIKWPSQPALSNPNQFPEKF
jgi:hypothetical protein